ncbi:GntR family transcriptional regulator, partial [Escherichia coli]|nr:GntR family transcriptional regulator [Escherichia coli]
MKQRGYLHSVHGQGTFTLPARSRENHLLHSFTDDIKARGGVPAQNILEIGYIPLSDIIRKNLELDIHVHTVFCIKRIRYMGSTPL